MNTRLTAYEENLQKYRHALATCNQKQKRFFIFRLVSFSAIILSLIYLPLYVAFLFATVSFILFFWSVRRVIRLDKEESFLKRLIDLNEREIKAINGNFNHFTDGKQFIDSSHPYTYDLDVFGQGSLFQFINRTTTPLGLKKLANLLKSYETEIEQLQSRQCSIADLETDLEWRQLFAAKSNLDNEKDLKLLNQFSQKDRLRNPERIRIAITWIPLISFVCVVLAIAGWINWSILLGLAIFNTVVLTFSKKTIDKYYDHYGSQAEILEKYQDLIELIEKRHFESPELIGLQNKLKIGDQTASSVIRQLKHHLSRFDYRGNFLFIAIADPLFLWDLIYVYKLYLWHRKYHQELEVWFDVMATFDALSSLSNFNFNHPDFVIPTFRNESFCFDAKNLAHPLIKSKVRVGNDFVMTQKGEIIILTGANMAGKSTFLRTIGINMILAMNGCRCCADKLTIKPILLYTNMRTTDNLMKAESYFHAELLRLQSILTQIKSGSETFVLIDEMLKGTNSADKLEGSKELTKQLIRIRANGIIATHDLKLTDLEEEFPQYIHTFCFEIEIENDNLIFDYKLQKGVTRTMNALFLMRKMGITAR